MPDANDLPVAAETTTPSASPAPAQDLAEILKGLLAPMQAQLDALTAENKAIREENEQVKADLAEQLASGRTVHIAGNDFPRNPSAARSVVLATRPVVDDPELYCQDGKHLIDPGGLSINTSSPLAGSNRE